jgi:hypothetical protein
MRWRIEIGCEKAVVIQIGGSFWKYTEGATLREQLSAFLRSNKVIRMMEEVLTALRRSNQALMLSMLKK